MSFSSFYFVNYQQFSSGEVEEADALLTYILINAVIISSPGKKSAER